MSNREINESRHGSETVEEREFSQSLADRTKVKGFFRELMHTAEDLEKARAKDDDQR